MFLKPTLKLKMKNESYSRLNNILTRHTIKVLSVYYIWLQLVTHSMLIKALIIMNIYSLVIFFVSQEQSLTGSESDREKGLRVFKSYDQQGKFFFLFLH